jgi:hypothetical protein
MTGPDTGHRGVDDVDRWEAVAQLRRRHRGWAIVWAPQVAEFRAYRRLPGSRRDTAVSAATADDLSAQISQAERAREGSARRRDRPRPLTGRHPFPLRTDPSLPKDDPPR